MKEFLTKLKEILPDITPGQWNIGTCMSGEKCWCRCIGTNDLIAQDHGVIGSGCVGQYDAKFIVLIQNNIEKIIEILEEKYDQSNSI